MKELYLELKNQGYKGQIVSVHRLSELEREIKHLHSHGLFSEEFYKKWLTSFKFNPPATLPGAKSLIVVAFPQPQHRAIFNWRGKRLPLLIPPTYLHYPDQKIEEILEGILNPLGFRLAKTELPLKLLATRGGLGSYGKNNICYIPGMGSFHRLMAFFSDLPFAEENWQDSKMMERCQNCSACLKSCPTGAITDERFLLRAELCLTFLNEGKGDFPSWINPSWHNCLVGCMNCQKVCPENKKFKGWIEDKEEFSEKETRLLLDGISQNNLPIQTLRKIENLDLIEYFDLLPRNLRVLIDLF